MSEAVSTLLLGLENNEIFRNLICFLQRQISYLLRSVVLGLASTDVFVFGSLSNLAKSPRLIKVSPLKKTLSSVCNNLAQLKK